MINIQKKLSEIEKVKNIKILYACETGSRAWGFPSPDSDYDVRIIYRHDPEWYLSLSDRDDTLEIMLNNGDLDITGWDIRKSLRLLWKSNGALLERIQSPIVYFETDGFVDLLKKTAPLCFSPIATLHHYLGMAKNSFSEVENKEEVKLKKLFYSLRASLACKWILDKGSIPPIVFDTMVNELDFNKGLKIRINELVVIKSGKVEAYMHPAEKELNALITKILQISAEKADSLNGRVEKGIDLDLVFREILRKY